MLVKGLNGGCHRPWILLILQINQLFVKNLTFVEILTYKFPKATPFPNASKKKSGQNMPAFQSYFGAKN
jgi:hypothetical protein